MKKEIKEKIEIILFDNIHRWESTDKVSTKEFNYLVKQILELLKSEKEKYIEALIWCSGSEDFQVDGKARKGWEKICLPLLKQALKKRITKKIWNGN